MKKRKGAFYFLFPVIITLTLYAVFYPKIGCKLGDAGFWILIALGISLGAALTRFSEWLKGNRTDQE
jgi:hypothetical protein